jgi:hypothetical protein
MIQFQHPRLKDNLILRQMPGLDGGNAFEMNEGCFYLNRQRLELMREMYTNAADSSPTSPDGNLQSTSTNDIPTDPFYDRFPWFRPIGR